ncbi:MAG: serine/threonine-protein kinase [Planctomycetota bacterium]
MTTDVPPAEPDRDRRLEDLVAACIEADGRGDHDAIVTLLRASPDLADDARAQLDDLARAGLLEDQPREIGPYRILEPLGRGGMGAVYLAEQRSPVHRKVAIKLVKRGMDTREVLARFAAERQALALMNHPNVARVFDAGSTTDGRPYFVMEHVAGVPITEYCDRKALDMRARIGLLLQICEGVQHAHLKGIVHRDLKPSNLLVAEQDGQPVAKIIDFGIAKATDQRLGGATLHTVQGVVLGTPEYMSPEQAGRDALDVDLRTDVYSLGVVAYELLSGELPFPSERLRTDPARLVAILREEEPDSPSRRIATLRRETASHAKRRNTTVDELVRTLRGDLDWICMKALEKDRERRYATVNEFAADLRRHLANEPVLAGPPSRWYRLRKFARRNRIQVGAAGAVLLSLIAGLVTSLRFYGDAHEAALAAQAALQRESVARRNAETDFEAALAAVDTLLTKVADKRLFGVPRMDGIRRAMLLDAEAFYRRFLESHGDDPRARFQAASAKNVLARISLSLGRTKESIDSARTAVTELERLASGPDAPQRARHELALARDTLGQALSEVGRMDEAIAAMRAAIADQRVLLAQAPGDHERRLHLVGTLCDCSFASRDSDPKASIDGYREAQQVLEAMRVEGKIDPEVERLAAVAGNGLAGTLLTQRDILGAEQAITATRTALAKLDLDHTFDVDVLEAVANVNRKAALICYSTGRLPEAVTAGTAEVAAMERMVRDYPEVPGYRSLLASAWGNLAVIRSAIRLDDEARSAFRRAAEEFEELARQHPEVDDFRRSLATYAGNLAHALVLDGKRASLAEAKLCAERAITALRSLTGGSGSDPQIDDRIAHNLLHLADIAMGDGRLQDAQHSAEEALALSRAARLRTPDQPAFDATFVAATISVATTRLAAARSAGGSLDGTSELLAQAIAVSDTEIARTPDDPDTRSDRSVLFRLDGIERALRGDRDGAVRAANDAIAAAGEDWHGALAKGEILALLGAGGAADALRDALTKIEADLAAAPDQVDVERVRDRVQVALARLVAEHGSAAEAIAMLKPAVESLRRLRDDHQVDPDCDLALASGLTACAGLALDLGDRATARTMAEALAAEFPTPQQRVAAAALLARAEQIERALDLLEDCARNPTAEFGAALDDAAFIRLRSEPRFAALRKRIGR